MTSVSFFALAAVFFALASAQYASARKVEAEDPAKARKTRQFATLIFFAAVVIMLAGVVIMFNRS